MNLSQISTKELVCELKSRDGVKAIIAEPYKNVEIKAEGPAIIFVVID
jgi:hypothetical protein